jgi:FixJ family two-component response regulator
MGPDFLRAISSGQSPRILIAENNRSTVESLIQTIGDRRLDVEYDVCTSHDHAVVKLFRSPPPYQVIISSVRLAEIDNFFLLKHNHNHQSFVPFLVTNGASDIESSRRALKEGAFDFIPTPLEHEQTVSTIRLALWHNKFKALIASRDKVLERYRRHIADYPGNRDGEGFQAILTSIQQTVYAFDRTIHQIETSIRSYTDLAKTVEDQDRNGVFKRLDSSYGPPR